MIFGTNPTVRRITVRGGGTEAFEEKRACYLWKRGQFSDDNSKNIANFY